MWGKERRGIGMREEEEEDWCEGRRGGALV